MTSITIFIDNTSPKMRIKSVFSITLVCSAMLTEKIRNAKSMNHFIPWYRDFKKDKIGLAGDDIRHLSVHEYYYKTLSNFAGTPCTVKKSLGGQWIRLSHGLQSWCEIEGNCETWPQMDGVKTFCMDKIYTYVISCLLYTSDAAEEGLVVDI